MRKLLLIGLVLGAVAAATTLACSDSDDGTNGATLTAEEQTMYCKDVAATRASVEAVSKAVVTNDSAAMKTATASVRSSVDSLNRWGRELEGGDDLLAELDQDVTDLESLAANPNLTSVQDQVKTQVDSITKDLDDLESAGNCP